jgi:hypothetical protein
MASWSTWSGKTGEGVTEGVAVDECTDFDFDSDFDFDFDFDFDETLSRNPGGAVYSCSFFWATRAHMLAVKTRERRWA